MKLLETQLWIWINYSMQISSRVGQSSVQFNKKNTITASALVENPKLRPQTDWTDFLKFIGLTLPIFDEKHNQFFIADFYDFVYPISLSTPLS